MRVRSKSSRRHPPIQRSAIAFMRGVRTLQSTVRIAVADHELGPMCLLAEVHHQVASLLGGHFSGWMQGDYEDADAPGGVLYPRQDMGLGAVEQVGGEEVARQDRLGLGTQ